MLSYGKENDMTWRLEASGGTGSANFVVIRPVEDDVPSSDIRHAIITVSPKGGRDHPTLPLFPEGYIYRDRTSMAYRILRSTIVESGSYDGEHSTWRYEYLAAFSAVVPIGQKP
jgi:hypothetical protein